MNRQSLGTLTAHVAGLPLLLRQARSSVAPLSVLQGVVIGAGLFWSIGFVWLGLVYHVEAYGDGSIFAYAIAVQDTWAFHWHNIAPRLTVYAFTMLPAEFVVRITGNPYAGMATYGGLFFGTQILGLVATWCWDISPRKLFFTFACASVMLLDPLVFGAPSEVWVSNAFFWPTLAYGSFKATTKNSMIVMTLLMSALVLSHETALPFAVMIATSVLIFCIHPLQKRAALVALAIAILAWSVIKVQIPPDAYYADVLKRAALNFFNPSLLLCALVLILTSSLVFYLSVLAILHRCHRQNPTALAVALTLGALAVYWLWYDHTIHAESRYYMRTFLAGGILVLGTLAVLVNAHVEHGASSSSRWIARGFAFFQQPTSTRGLCGALCIVTGIYIVETAKFVSVWDMYQRDLRSLVLSEQADPSLGNPAFVSSKRLGTQVSQLAWYSTTPYLGLIVSNFQARRLPIDAIGRYFWLACSTATQNMKATRVVPESARDMIRVYSCLHRQD